CIFGAVVAVIWYGSVLVSAGDISVGDLTTYILYSLFVAGSMGSFPELYANIQKAIGASERVIEILDEQQEDAGLLQTEKTIRNPIDGNLTFENVSFAYPSRREITVRKAVSFD